MGGLIQGLLLGAIGAAVQTNEINNEKERTREELFVEFHSDADARYKQELLLALASFSQEKYSFFTYDCSEWLYEIRKWFSALSIQSDLNAYDVLLMLLSDYDTYQKGRLLVEL